MNLYTTASSIECHRTRIVLNEKDIVHEVIQVDPKKLLAYNVHIDDISDAIEGSNRNAGGWYMDRGNEQLIIRGVGWVRSGDDGIRDIGNVPLKQEDGNVVNLFPFDLIAYRTRLLQGK